MHLLLFLPAAVGLVVLGALLITGPLYLAVCELKRRHTATSQAPLARGAFRLAAARGEVKNLDLLWRLLGPEGLGTVDAKTASGFTALHAGETAAYLQTWPVGGKLHACIQHLQTCVTLHQETENKAHYGSFRKNAD